MKYNPIPVREKNTTVFDMKHKQELGFVEKIGLAFILADFIREYEEVAFGEATTNILEYTQYNADRVDILDGQSNTYIYGGYAIDSIWMTENETVILECREIGEDVDVSAIDIYDFPRVLFILS